MVATINESIQNVNASLAKLASGAKKFEIQNDFVSKLVDTLKAGIGNLHIQDAISCMKSFYRASIVVIHSCVVLRGPTWQRSAHD